MVKAGDFVWVPDHGDGDDDGGRVDFAFTTSESTTVKFGFEVVAPSNQSDSMFIRVDDGNMSAWRLPHIPSWAWRTFGIGFNVSAGNHTLEVHLRGDGTKLRAVNVTQGQACFGTSAARIVTAYIEAGERGRGRGAERQRPVTAQSPLTGPLPCRIAPALRLPCLGASAQRGHQHGCLRPSVPRAQPSSRERLPSTLPRP